MLVGSFTWGDLADLALAVFLFAVGIALAYAFLRLGETLRRLSTFIKGVEQELLPVIDKVGGSVDRVNGQLDKVDRITDSAVDAAESVDTAVRAVTGAVVGPVRRLTGFTAGVTYGAAELKARRDWRGAVQAGREAAARREEDFVRELEEARRHA